MSRIPLHLLAIWALLWLLGPCAVSAQEAEVSAAPQPPPPPEVPQPAYDVFRIEDGGAGRAYRVWEEWVPRIVNTPDGGAWVFFTAQARSEEGFGLRRLFATRFDPDLSIWLPAHAIGNATTQFGVSAVVDSKGVIHVVYSERAVEGDDGRSQLVYQRLVDGTWADPVAIAPHPDAGYQMLASLAIDSHDGLHVIWRDQRFVSAEARAALPTNADLLVSDFVGGEWTAPTQVNVRETPDLNPAWPHLAVDGDRLVVVWSIYQGTTPDEMKSAARVEWSVRPLDSTSAWSPPQTLFVRESGDAGGRLIDLAADPRGGAVVVYGLYNKGVNQFYLRRLERDAPDWTEPVLLAQGDYGYLPALTIAPDGTMFTVFNSGRNRDVDIGGLVVDPTGKTLGAVILTPADGGIAARASVSLDKNGVPWVVYMHQPVGSTNVTEIQAVRAATFVPPAPS